MPSLEKSVGSTCCIWAKMKEYLSGRISAYVGIKARKNGWHDYWIVTQFKEWVSTKMHCTILFLFTTRSSLKKVDKNQHIETLI